MILTVSNLYPYPNQHVRGVFNAQLFSAMAAKIPVTNRVLVATPAPWRFAPIRRWVCPHPPPPQTRYIPYLHMPVIGRGLASRLAAAALHADEQRHHDEPRPSAILASWLYPDGIAAASLFGRANVPVWIMVLGTDRFHLRSASRRRLILKTGAQVAGWICVSRNIALDLEAAGIPESRIHVIPNGVDRHLFYPVPQAEARQALQNLHAGVFEPTARTLLWIGNLVPVKAPLDAIEAFATVVLHYRQRNEPAPHLVIIGDGPMQPRMRRRGYSLKLENLLYFAGRRPHPEIPVWLNAADGLLLSSLSEGMPNAIVEALACGCPVTATDTGTCREMLKEQPCCHVVPASDTTALAMATEAMLHEMRNTARPTFERTWADMADDILKLIYPERKAL